MEVTKSDDRDVAVPRSFKMSKSKAQKALKRYLLKPELLNRSTADDAKAGVTRIQVVVTGRGGHRVPLVEVSGEEAHVWKAAVMAGLDRIGYAVSFEKLEPPPMASADIKKMFEALPPQMVVRRQKKSEPVAEPAPVSVPFVQTVSTEALEYPQPE